LFSLYVFGYVIDPLIIIRTHYNHYKSLASLGSLSKIWFLMAATYNTPMSLIIKAAIVEILNSSLFNNVMFLEKKN